MVFKATRNLVYSAVFIAIGVVLPMAFHSVGMGGSVFLPMHIPVLIGGLFLGWRAGLMIGLVTPILSCLLTGMPPLLPMLPIMVAELGVYGAISGLLYREIKANLILSLVVAMLAGRVTVGLVIALFAESLGVKITPLVFIGAAVSKGLIGIIIQFCFVPLCVNRLEKFKLNKN